MVGFSQGCEPYFLMCFKRNSRVGTFKDGSPTFIKWLEENGIDYSEYNFNLDKLREDTKVPRYFEQSLEISPTDHLKMQAVFAKYVDSSVSKTINLPADATVEDIENSYIQAYKMEIKSTTIYRYGSKEQILEQIKEEERVYRPSEIVDAHAPGRPKELECDICHTSVKGEKWTVLVGLLHSRPYEIFCAPQDAFELSAKYKKGTLVKNGHGSYNLETEDFKLKNISRHLESDEHRVITRLISTCLRHGVPTGFVADQLAKADGTIVDFSKAMLRILKKYDGILPDGESAHTCSNCGSTNVVLNGGCPECLDCGLSKCG
jgi:ribonucleoside-diphosphate reductase alpha chain